MKISVCTGKACSGRFSEYILTRLKNDKTRFNIDKLFIEESPCMGKCSEWPNVKVDNNLRNYMNPAKVAEVVMSNHKNKQKQKKKK